MGVKARTVIYETKNGPVKKPSIIVDVEIFENMRAYFKYNEEFSCVGYKITKEGYTLALINLERIMIENPEGFLKAKQVAIPVELIE